MIVLQLTEGQDPGSSANRIYEIIGRKYEDQVEGQPYITAEFARDESRTVFTVGDGKYYSRSAIAEAKRKRKDTSGELTTDTLNLCVHRSSKFIPHCSVLRGKVACNNALILSLCLLRQECSTLEVVYTWSCDSPYFFQWSQGSTVTAVIIGTSKLPSFWNYIHIYF